MNRPSALQAVDTVLFDLDGTLIDTIELIFDSFQAALANTVGYDLAKEEFLQVFGRPLDQQVQAFADDPAAQRRLADDYRRRYRERHSELARPYPGAPEAIRTLKARGYVLGIVTSKHPETTQMALQHCGLEGLFEAVVDVYGAARHKPAPEPIWRALELLGKTPAQAAMVGDSCSDLQSARTAGVVAIGVTWGPLGDRQVADADVLVASFEELLALFPPVAVR